jgi:hypothetical protein
MQYWMKLRALAKRAAPYVLVASGALVSADLVNPFIGQMISIIVTMV